MNLIKNHTILKALKVSWEEFSDERAFRHGAALAYYAIFSLVPIMVLLLTIFGLFVGQYEVEQIFMRELANALGPDNAEFFHEGIHNISAVSEQNWLVKTIGIVVLLFSATAVFYSIKNSIHSLWHIPLSRQSIWSSLVDRGVSLIVLMASGLILMVVFFAESVAISSITSITDWFGIPQIPFVVIVEFMVAVVLNWFIFYVIYRFLPDVTLNRKVTIVGSLVVAFVFQIGSALIGWYLHEQDLNSTYGIIGSIMLILAWVYYSAQVIFFGAKFLYVYNEDHGYGLTRKSRL